MSLTYFHRDLNIPISDEIQLEAMAYDHSQQISPSDVFSAGSYEDICQPGTSSQDMSDSSISALNSEAVEWANVPMSVRFSSKPDSFIQSKF